MTAVDDAAKVIAEHAFGDLIGDYDKPPHYAMFLTCRGCDWRHNIDGMSGWRSWVAKHAEHVAEVLAAAGLLRDGETEAERDALRDAVADLARDHTVPPNKDSYGYSYRMGWWDAVNFAANLTQRRVRAARASAKPVKT